MLSEERIRELMTNKVAEYGRLYKAGAVTEGLVVEIRLLEEILGQSWLAFVKDDA